MKKNPAEIILKKTQGIKETCWHNATEIIPKKTQEFNEPGWQSQIQKKEVKSLIKFTEPKPKRI